MIVASAQDLSGAVIDLETDFGKVVVNGKDQGAAFKASGTDDVRQSVQNDHGDVELTF